jgi:hypothetical protein
MPDTNVDRQRRWRQRQAGVIPPVKLLVCETEACGRRHTGVHGGLCWRCWEQLTPEGRAARAKRVRQWRARRRDDS